MVSLQACASSLRSSTWANTVLTPMAPSHSSFTDSKNCETVSVTWLPLADHCGWKSRLTAACSDGWADEVRRRHEHEVDAGVLHLLDGRLVLVAVAIALRARQGHVHGHLVTQVLEGGDEPGLDRGGELRRLVGGDDADGRALELAGVVEQLRPSRVLAVGGHRGVRAQC